MIGDIGIMVGAYIIVRMLSLCERESESTLVRVLAKVALVVAIISVLDILLKGRMISSVLFPK